VKKDCVTKSIIRDEHNEHPGEALTVIKQVKKIVTKNQIRLKALDKKSIP